MYAYNNKFSKCMKQQLTELKAEIDSDDHTCRVVPLNNS